MGKLVPTSVNNSVFITLRVTVSKMYCCFLSKSIGDKRRGRLLSTQALIFSLPSMNLLPHHYSIYAYIAAAKTNTYLH